MVAVDQVRRETFDMGRVARRTFEVISRNLVPFGLMTFLLAGVPAFLIGWWQLASVAQMQPGLAGAGAMLGRSLITIVLAVINLGILGVLQAGIVHGSIRDLEGRPSAVGDLLSTGIRFALPAAGISILYFLAVFAGSILLIVPGFMIAIAWMVALPSAVVEKTGVFGAFSRSGQLTKGSRWRIFGLVFVYFVLMGIIQMTILGLTGALVRPTPGVALSAASIFPRLILQLVLNTINYLIASTAVAVIYQELRTLREGVLPASLGSVFD